MRHMSMAAKAKSLIHQASRNLGLPSPLEDVGDVLEQSLAYPAGERYHDRDPLSPTFAETTPENLSFMVSADGPRVTPADRIQSSTHNLRRLVSSRFGPQALRWLDSRVEGLNGEYSRAASWGASFGSSFDRNGLNEAYVQYEWGPLLMDTLPAPLYRLARAALETLPGLRPALTAVRCGRSSGSQQVTFEVARALALNDLRPLMERLGIGHQHASLMSALAFVLGARFTLPPETSLLTLRPARAGVELRLDVVLDALPDPPAQLMALMRLQMTERPKSVQGLDRWLMALTPDGLPGPGTVSVLSAWVRPDMPARLALYLHPAALDEKAVAPAPSPVASAAEEEAEWSSSAWAPVN
jgi:hypothetical protein